MTDSDTTDRQLQINRIDALCHEFTTENPARTLVVYIAQGGRVLLERGFGLMRPLSDSASSNPISGDAIFLVASLTKPLTAAALSLLVDRGQVLLDDPVSLYIPAFSGKDRQGVRLRHLLTHTSGLPDMLPENIEMRQAHAPLSLFIEKTCTTRLLFAPGADCRYQSMGTLLAARIVETVSGMALPDFLQSEFFAPLGMTNTWLGLGELDQRRIVRVMLSSDDDQSSWGWNSSYWRNLGSPWGGLHTSASDYARLLLLMLGQGQLGGQRVLSAPMARAMLTDQLASITGLSDRARREQAWGLGWRLNQPAGAHNLPELGPASVFGHAGATGTVAWASPESDIVCVILTNDPQSMSMRGRLSNLVAGLA